MNNDNVATEPINKLMECDKWNSGSANLTFDGSLIESHGKTLELN